MQDTRCGKRHKKTLKMREKYERLNRKKNKKACEK